MRGVENFAWCIDNCLKVQNVWVIYLDDSIIIGHISVTSKDVLDKSKMWQLKLRHVSEKCLVELSKQGLLWGEELNKLEFCDN